MKRCNFPQDDESYSKGTVCSSSIVKPLTHKDIEQAIKELTLCKYKKPTLPDHKPSWFEKLMNKLGWYRQTTVYVLDTGRLEMLCSNTFKVTGIK